ncbi:MAG: T9SS type A sorting domain-containing protein [Balneolia bacterium]|nr:T9SS type A sorting domain-containing protein [Balneolia bacterium]MCH8559061.1 T9SS type A sorting domain-containing protein [Balneolia bacterium]
MSFDGSALSSGVYLYRLQTATGVITRKMMLVK